MSDRSVCDKVLSNTENSFMEQKNNQSSEEKTNSKTDMSKVTLNFYGCFNKEIADYLFPHFREENGVMILEFEDIRDNADIHTELKITFDGETWHALSTRQNKYYTNEKVLYGRKIEIFNGNFSDFVEEGHVTNEDRSSILGILCGELVYCFQVIQDEDHDYAEKNDNTEDDD